MKFKYLLAMAGLALSFTSVAGTMGPAYSPPVALTAALPWAAIGSLGYIGYQHSNDGETAIGRFAIAKGLFRMPYSL